MRCQLPVYSPLSITNLLGAAVSNLGGATALEAVVAKRHGVSDVLLVDSGTSALVLAFRELAAAGLIRIACPAYVCVDVGAAAMTAGVKLVLYDTDPGTLSPDIASLERVVHSGAQAVLVAHLYGYPVAVEEIVGLCGKASLPLIEDAAQEAGAEFRGRRLGSFGDRIVLSFGRGKGLTGGGGALLGREAESIPDAALNGSHPAAGWSSLAASAAQWMLGRPQLYAIPLAIPSLKLGEMVYKPAGVPQPMSRMSVSLVRRALALEHHEIEVRRRHAQRLSGSAAGAPGLATVRWCEGAHPSSLRFPVIDQGGRREPSRALGITPGYPRLLDENPEIRGVAERGAERLTGATELRDSLLTLPTHSLLRQRDFQAMEEWLQRP